MHFPVLISVPWEATSEWELFLPLGPSLDTVFAWSLNSEGDALVLEKESACRASSVQFEVKEFTHLKFDYRLNFGRNQN